MCGRRLTGGATAGDVGDASPAKSGQGVFYAGDVPT